MSKPILALQLFAAAFLTLSLASSCNKEKVETPDEPTATAVHSIQVAVPVGKDTKATYAKETATSIETGDKLYLQVSGDDYTYVGVLDNSEGAKTTFTGTLNKTSGSDYSGTDIITDCTSLEATLLPIGYEGVGYLTLTKPEDVVTGLTVNADKAICYATAGSALDKSKAVPQVANESCSLDGSGSKSITLSPQNAILYYTLNNAGASTTFDVSVSDGTTTISKNVGSDGDGKLCFAVGFAAPGSEKSYMMNISGQQTIEYRGTPAAKQVVNITRNPLNAEDRLNGVFSVAADRRVKFSKGNLKATLDAYGKVSSWAFHTYQYDRVYSSSSPVDQEFTSHDIDYFGWSTPSTLYGISSSTSASKYSGDFVDWGAAASKSLGYGWRTLTGGSGGEWQWILGPSSPDPGTNCRTSSTIGSTENARFVKATVHSTKGLIIFPDEITWNATTMGDAPTTCNTAGNAFTYSPTDANWAALEAAGCVFLPTGYRNGTQVIPPSPTSEYWASTYIGDNFAHYLDANPGSVNPAISQANRSGGYAVRLVQEQP